MIRPHRRLALVALALAGAAGLAPAQPRPAPAPAIAWEPHTLRLSDGRTVAGELGRLEVPERRDRADSRRIGLAFLRLASTSERPGPPIVFLAGGPGDSGIDIATIPAYHALFERLRAVGDVILLDQRGIGRSGPAPSCPPAGPPALDMLTTRDVALARMSALVRACAERLRAQGVDLAGYTTEASADDLEALRAALGVPAVSLLAHSYGTHLALAAVRRHPGSLARVVLASTEGPDDTWKYPHVYDQQLRRLAHLAARDTAAAEPDLFARAERVLARLEREPVMVTLTDPATRASVQVPIGRGGLQYILRRDLGDASDVGSFPALLRAIERGDPSMLERLAQRRYGNFGVRGIAMIRYVVDCASGADAARLARIERESAASLLGAATNDLFPEICDAAGVPRLPDAFRAPITSTIPTLFLSGTLDANTPPHQAERVRWGFADSHHLIVEHAGHESLLPHPEVQAIIVAFLRGDDVRARRVSLPPPSFRQP